MHIGRGTLLTALDAWMRANAVPAPPVDSCGIWECCGYYKTGAETRDALEGLLHDAPPRARRELRRLIRQADRRIVGDLEGPWWRDPLLWTDGDKPLHA